MYFNAEIQQKILSRFHFALNPGGILFLGKAEMLLNHNSSFQPLDLKRRIFIRVNSKPSARDRVGPVVPFANGAGGDGNALAAYPRLRDIAVDVDPAANLICDMNGTVLVINEKARYFFGLSQRDVGRPLQDLEISYRPVELRSLIERACSERQQVTQKDITWISRGGEERSLEITTIPLLDPTGTVLGTKIIFCDVTKVKRLNDELLHSKQELETAYEELQSSNEELETTNEELQSTIEELETTNEELQSTNEELETMNEELQSTNEEMETINDELRKSSDELNSVNGFLESILTGLRYGVTVLNRELVIEVWNRRAEDLWGLRSDEVIGRSFMSLDIGLPVADLRAAIKGSITGETDGWEVSLPAVNRRGRAITCRITGTPLHDKIPGTAPQPRGVILLMEEHETDPRPGGEAAGPK